MDNPTISLGEMPRTFADMEQAVLKRGIKTRIAVVEAQDELVLQAVATAQQKGMIEPVLIGCPDKIAPLLERVGLDERAVTVLPADSGQAGARTAAGLVNGGQVDGIMKGHLETGELMGVLVHKQGGITLGRPMSMVALMESPYYPKLFGMTDIGLMTYPTLEQKKAILSNAVELFRVLGCGEPRVALLSAIEKVNEKMPDTVENAQLAEFARGGGAGRCVADGPISYDLAICPEACRRKEYAGGVQGDADILMVPDIVSGNLMCKALIYSGGAKTGGIVVGAKVPIIVTSRSASFEDKYHAILVTSFVRCQSDGT